MSTDKGWSRPDSRSASLAIDASRKLGASYGPGGLPAAGFQGRASGRMEGEIWIEDDFDKPVDDLIDCLKDNQPDRAAGIQAMRLLLDTHLILWEMPTFADHQDPFDR